MKRNFQRFVEAEEGSTRPQTQNICCPATLLCIWVSSNSEEILAPKSKTINKQTHKAHHDINTLLTQHVVTSRRMHRTTSPSFQCVTITHFSLFILRMLLKRLHLASLGNKSTARGGSHGQA